MSTRYLELDESRKFDIIFLGRVAVDFNPAYSELVKEEFKPLKKVHYFEKFVGGSQANTACGITRHGMKAGFFATVSDDQLGDFVVDYIAVEGWYPLGGTHGGNDILFKDPVIQEIAGRYGKTPAEIILRWHVQEGFSTIPGSRNPAHIKQNISVYSFKLSEDDMNKIRALDGEKRFFTSTWEEIQRFNDWKPED